MKSEIIPDNIEVSSNAIAIVGWEEGGDGQIESWLERESSFRIACFVNPVSEVKYIDVEAENAKRDTRLFEYPMHDSFKKKPMITSSNWIEILKGIGIEKVLITTSCNEQRMELIKKARNRLELINVIHPTATIMEDVILHDNVMIYARAFIGYRTEVFSGALINNNSFLDHHNVVRHCAQIAPGVVTAGNVTIGECACVWTGAVIKNKIRIGDHSVVGAGTVVIKDAPDYSTVIGVPGQLKKEGTNQ